MRLHTFFVAVVLLCAQCPAADIGPTGSVRDVSGKPVAGAKVMLYAKRNLWGLDNEVVEAVQTDAIGAYQFRTPLHFKIPNCTDYTDHYPRGRSTERPGDYAGRQVPLRRGQQ